LHVLGEEDEFRVQRFHNLETFSNYCLRLLTNVRVKFLVLLGCSLVLEHLGLAQTTDENQRQLVQVSSTVQQATKLLEHDGKRLYELNDAAK
jgi:hypothetical protein